jgi:hypothetical protein
MKSFVAALVIALLLLVALLEFYACKRPTDDLDLIVNTDIYKAPVLLRFVNAKSTATKQPGDFNVSITGKNANLVNTGDGGKDFKAVSGFVTLALDPSANPTPEHPVSFMVSADVPGFKRAHQLVTITGEEPADYIVPVQDYSDPAEGTAAIVRTINLENGTVPSQEIMTTSTSAKLSQTATIKIPAGTQVMDADGNVLTSGNLESKIIFYGTGSQEALNSFPGGFVATDVIGQDGKPVENGGTFVTGGFLSVDMKAGSKEVKKFSKPIEVTAQLASDLVNPSTGIPVQAGDTIPIWSLNEETGQWQYESTATVGNSGGKPSVNFSASHLSCWNIDWFCYYWCYGPLSFQISMADPAYRARLWLHLETANGQYLGGIYTNNTWSTPVELYHGFTNKFYWLPGCINLTKLAVYDRYTYRKICETPLFNPCSGGNIVVNIPTGGKPDIVKIKISMKGKCNKKNVTTNLTGWAILYNQANWYDYTSFYIKNGTATLQLPNGGTYTFQTVYGGKIYSTTITLNKTNFTFPAGNGITGTATFDAATNTLTLKGTIQIPNCY